MVMVGWVQAMDGIKKSAKKRVIDNWRFILFLLSSLYLTNSSTRESLT
jgi:hypothetical protein